MPKSRLVWFVCIGFAFVFGLIAADPDQSSQARDGWSNSVLEITQSGAGLAVRSSPDTSAHELDTLYWGDRVLWTGDQASGDGYTWLKVGISDGRTGWMADVDGWTIVMDPVYTTPGMGVGAQVRVTWEGDASHCRALPSASSTEYRTLQENDRLTVMAGPYQAEYWVWWQYRLSSGFECWIVDVPGWFEVTQSGTF